MIVGIGVDVVELQRIRDSVIRRGHRLARRVLGDEEWKVYLQRGDPVSYLAGRFAAKEALAKALGTGIGRVAFREIQIVSSEGAPRVRLEGRAAKVARQKGICRWHVSISHGRDVATAFVVAEGPDGGAETDGSKRGIRACRGRNPCT
ncbi:MAG: holo-ACP synthase [Alicyclobacillaceae bacterium]|nr:holo-ACP synthase [Alicyclobacillaceae bacterium]